jgi:peptide/nickel transport system permease protein
MINYLIRRFIQMAIVLFFSSVAAYTLLSLAPGGPLSFLGSVQKRLNQEDMARIRAYFEMDLSLQYRFSRWLIGVPRGPITIFGKTFLADFVVGCRMPISRWT